jgi:hypothetical protein
MSGLSGTFDLNVARAERVYSQVAGLESSAGIAPRREADVQMGAATGSSRIARDQAGAFDASAPGLSQSIRLPFAPGNTDEYSTLTRNIFHSPLDEPLSTFSIDVDTAFYAQLRSMPVNWVLGTPLPLFMRSFQPIPRSRLHRDYFHNLRDFFFDNAFNARFQSESGHRAAVAGSFEANFHHVVCADID